MDAYPPEYTAHCLPLIAISGLGQPASVRNARPTSENVALQSPTTTPSTPASPSPAAPTTPAAESDGFAAVPDDIAEQLRLQFLEFDGTTMPWRARPNARAASLLPFTIRLVDRTFSPPAKKAVGEHNVGSPGPGHVGLHSPLSPLTATSPTFPNILMTPRWLRRHQHDLPPVFVAFFYFRSHPGSNDDFDARLRDEIVRLRARLWSRVYFAVALVSEKSIFESVEIERRISAICRASGLDEKSQLFFLPPKVSVVEMSRFAASVLSSMQMLCVDYYRDLAKHARQKRNRRSVSSAPDGAVRPLSTFDWRIRYDFKQAVFAEFQQDIEQANQLYTAALRALLGPEGVFTTTAVWTARWAESRMLADVIGIRIIKCYLWYGLTTSAVQFWASFRRHVKLLLDNHGEGTGGYGWQAWEANWAAVMADLITKADVFDRPTKPAATTTDFAPVEMKIAAEFVVPPWQRLHRPAYWRLLSARHSLIRLQLARMIQPDDRKAPTTRARRPGQIQDRYFCLEPHRENPADGQDGFDHTVDIATRFIAAADEFSRTNRPRMADYARLGAAKHLFLARRFETALATVKPVWQKMRWRPDGWLDLVSDVLVLVLECATVCGDVATAAAVRWELMNSVFVRRDDVEYDLASALGRMSLVAPDERSGSSSPEAERRTTTTVEINSATTLSFLSLSFQFERPSTELTVPAKAQIVIHSNAHKDSPPIQIRRLVIHCSGYVGSIVVDDDCRTEGRTSQQIDQLDLTCQSDPTVSESPLQLKGRADMLIAAGQHRVLELAIAPRRTGVWTVESMCATVPISDQCTVEFTDEIAMMGTPSTTTSTRPARWWIECPTGLRSMDVIEDAGSTMTIQPKTSLLSVSFKDVQEQYYNDETVRVRLAVTSAEPDEVIGSAEFRFTDTHGKPVMVGWAEAGESSPFSRKPGMTIDLGVIAAGETGEWPVTLTVPTPPHHYRLDATIKYTLRSDPDIRISQRARLQMALLPALDPRFRFSPVISHMPWPGPDETTEKGTIEIVQHWYLQCMLAPHSSSAIELVSAKLRLLSDPEEVQCEIRSASESEDQSAGPAASPSPFYRPFDILLTETAPSDRPAVPLDFSLTVVWRRAGTDEDVPPAITMVAVPRFVAAPLDLRVLASAEGYSSRSDAIRNEYMVENPTNRPHTLSVTLSPNQTFNLGPDQARTQVVQLAPLSRQPVVFTLSPRPDLVANPNPASRWMIVHARVERRNEKMPPLYIWPTGDIRLDPHGLRVKF